MYRTVSGAALATLADTLGLVPTNFRDVYSVPCRSSERPRNKGAEMTRKRTILLTAGALALGATAFAGASLAGGGWHRDHGHHGSAGQSLFETFDANQDGTLTQAEVDQARQSKLAEFDRDGNGSLSLEEYQALWMDAMRERMVDRFQGHDDDGDGMVTAEEFGNDYSRIIS